MLRQPPKTRIGIQDGKQRSLVLQENQHLELLQQQQQQRGRRPLPLPQRLLLRQQRQLLHPELPLQQEEGQQQGGRSLQGTESIRPRQHLDHVFQPKRRRIRIKKLLQNMLEKFQEL